MTQYVHEFKATDSETILIQRLLKDYLKSNNDSIAVNLQEKLNQLLKGDLTYK